MLDPKVLRERGETHRRREKYDVWNEFPLLEVA